MNRPPKVWTKIQLFGGRFIDNHAEIEFEDEHTAVIEFYGVDAERAVAAFYDKNGKSDVVTVGSENETIVVNDPTMDLAAYEIKCSHWVTDTTCSRCNSI